LPACSVWYLPVKKDGPFVAKNYLLTYRINKVSFLPGNSFLFRLLQPFLYYFVLTYNSKIDCTIDLIETKLHICKQQINLIEESLNN